MPLSPFRVGKPLLSTLIVFKDKEPITPRSRTIERDSVDTRQPLSSCLVLQVYFYESFHEEFHLHAIKSQHWSYTHGLPRFHYLFLSNWSDSSTRYTHKNCHSVSFCGIWGAHSTINSHQLLFPEIYNLACSWNHVSGSKLFLVFMNYSGDN